MSRWWAFGLATLWLTGAVAAHADAVRVGDRLPDLTVTQWQGGSVALDAWRGRVVVLDFWASWCQICRTALPHLDAMSRRYAEQGLVVVAVNIDSDRRAAQGFLDEYIPRPSVTLLHDPSGSAFARFGASGMPALYVAGRDGVVRMVEVGYLPDRIAKVERVVEGLIGESPSAAR